MEEAHQMCRGTFRDPSPSLDLRQKTDSSSNKHHSSPNNNSSPCRLPNNSRQMPISPSHRWHLLLRPPVPLHHSLQITKSSWVGVRSQARTWTSLYRTWDQWFLGTSRSPSPLFLSRAQHPLAFSTSHSSGGLSPGLRLTWWHHPCPRQCSLKVRPSIVRSQYRLCPGRALLGRLWECVVRVRHGLWRQV